jgi:hypothetical protein
MTASNFFSARKIIFSALLFFSHSIGAFSQVVGCKDPAAANFNPSATVTDSSCVYDTTPYTPPVKLNAIDNVLAETSGLQWAGNSLWSFNDGGGTATIYRVDTSTGAVVQTVNLEGATNIDWEDIGFDGSNFYIGDFGNNFGGRTDLKIYKLPLSAIPTATGNPTVTVPSSDIKIINFSYSDQIPVVATAEANKTKFDCEAMIIDGGAIHLFTKNWIGTNTTHYVINSTEAGTYSAIPVEMLNTSYLVTGADKVPGSKVAVLLGYQNGGFYNHYMHVLTDFTDGLFFTGNRRKLNLPTVFGMGQAEGISFINGTYGFISNESVSAFGISQKLFSFNTAAFTPLYVLPVDLINFNVSQTKDEHMISWHFGLPVKNLSILRSTGGINFTPLRKYARSTTDQLSIPATTSQTCYKLQWEQANGTYTYSQTICVNDKTQKGIRNLVLKANGELSLTVNGNKKEKYRFNLIQVDGKLMAQTEGLLLPGTNSIHFNYTFNQGALIFLQATNNTDQKSILLRVE